MTDKVALTCENDNRRETVRQRYLNGLDYLEVCEDRRTLRVYFLGKAPERREEEEEIKRENVLVEGGRRVRDLRVVDLSVHRREDEPDLDDWMEVVVDRTGDFSTYTLRLVELDEDGRPTGRPMRDFDPRYAQLEFSFKAGCPTDLDCRAAPARPPAGRDEPETDYLAKDYASFRRLILDRLALVMPEWKERNASDLGVALVEVLAYAGDHLSYYQDAVATEAYLDTARKRVSVRRHARLVDHRLHEGCNARTWISIETDTDLALNPNDIAFVSGQDDHHPRGAVLAPEDLRKVPAGRHEVFEPLVGGRAQIYLREAHNRIRFYTWGDEECCLPRGATFATLRDEWEPDERRAPGQEAEETPEEPPPRGRVLRLRAGDVLVFEERLDPGTGNAADADRTHRHAVRLTKVTQTEDKLFDQPVVEAEWAPEDALPFALCLSAIGPAPACELLEDVSIVRGNVVLADHGQTLEDEPLGIVREAETTHRCGDGCHPAETVVGARRFRPRLKGTPLTFGRPVPAAGPVSGLLAQDPRDAEPRITELVGTHASPDGAVEELWSPRRDLLASWSEDAHFVVEVDDEGRANLRFGDGELGRMPEAGTAFRATYRVGNGPAGNLGAETINHLLFRRNPVNGVELSPRNPFPAQGGEPPESLAEAKLLAPHAFRTRMERAVTADDYARLAERHPKVQRAAATLRWTGSWPEVLVAVDPRFEESPDERPTTEAAFADAVRHTVERHLDPEDFRVAQEGETAGRVVDALRELRAGVERDDPPESLLALTREKLSRLREEHAIAVGRGYRRLEYWVGGLVAGLEQAVGLLPAGEPEGEPGAAAGDRLLMEIEAYLRPYRRIGHDLLVARARYVPLEVEMEVCVRPAFLRGHVKAALLDVFGTRTLPDGRRGFFHPDNLSFGDDILLSRLVAAAQAVAGVESVWIGKLERLFEGPNGEVENGVLPIGPHEVARLDNDPDFPENGRLRLVMGGGR